MCHYIKSKYLGEKNERERKIVAAAVWIRFNQNMKIVLTNTRTKLCLLWNENYKIDGPSLDGILYGLNYPHCMNAWHTHTGITHEHRLYMYIVLQRCVKCTTKHMNISKLMFVLHISHCHTIPSIAFKNSSNTIQWR